MVSKLNAFPEFEPKTVSFYLTKIGVHLPKKQLRYYTTHTYIMGNCHNQIIVQAQFTRDFARKKLIGSPGIQTHDLLTHALL